MRNVQYSWNAPKVFEECNHYLFFQGDIDCLPESNQLWTNTFERIPGIWIWAFDFVIKNWIRLNRGENDRKVQRDSICVTLSLWSSCSFRVKTSIESRLHSARFGQWSFVLKVLRWIHVGHSEHATWFGILNDCSWTWTSKFGFNFHQTVSWFRRERQTTSWISLYLRLFSLKSQIATTISSCIVSLTNALNFRAKWFIDSE